MLFAKEIEHELHFAGTPSLFPFPCQQLTSYPITHYNDHQIHFSAFPAPVFSKTYTSHPIQNLKPLSPSRSPNDLLPLPPLYLQSHAHSAI